MKTVKKSESIQITYTAVDPHEVLKLKARGCKIVDVKFVNELDDDGIPTDYYKVWHTAPAKVETVRSAESTVQEPVRSAPARRTGGK